MLWKRFLPWTSPPLPPSNLLAGVGQGDFWEIGRATVDLIRRTVGLTACERVLDVGCGLGRIAWPLSRQLGRRARYIGMDASRLYVDWCRHHLGHDRRLTFTHVDVRSRVYNPTGTIPASECVFEWPDASFDLVVATSLFTHLEPNATERFLAEIARVLSPTGRLFATFFVLDPLGRTAIARGATFPTFEHMIPQGRLHDPARPEAAIAFHPEWLHEALSRAGLRAGCEQSGLWKGAPGPCYQDVIAAARR